jgi:hypothetical protein
MTFPSSQQLTENLPNLSETNSLETQITYILHSTHKVISTSHMFGLYICLLGPPTILNYG